MFKGFMLSKRLLYAALFGVLILGGAVYFTQDTQGAPETADSTGALQESIPTTISTLPTSSAQASSTTTLTRDAATTTTELTETDVLTRNLLQPYIQKASAGTYSTKDTERIVQDATKEMFLLDYTALTPESISPSNNTTSQAAAQYKKDLYKALGPIFTLTEYELTTYARAVRDNDKEGFDSLKTVATAYQHAGDESLLIAPPNDVSAVHLSIINSLYKFATVLTTLAKGYNDPAASLSGTGNFTQAEEELGQAFTRLKTYFILKGVDTITL